MKTARVARAPRRAPARELGALRARLAEAVDALRAIRSGEVDTLVVAGERGPRVFTLAGAEHAYRLLIESMNEGALTVTSDKTILYANRCFSKMVGYPLSQVIGGSLRRFLSPGDRAALRAMIKRSGRSGAKIQLRLLTAGGTSLPVQVSVRRTAEAGLGRASFGMVVTDQTEVRRTEDLLRALTHRVVQVQEDERRRVALELHDGVTQMLCAMLFRSQMLVASLEAHDGPAKREARKLRDIAGQTATEAERVSRDLRSSLLDQLGLIAALRDASKIFSDRTGVPVTVTCGRLTVRLPADRELALYRIFQEALRNVEKHAGARSVSVDLTQPDHCVQMVIADDGVGFKVGCAPARGKGPGGVGLFLMRERASFAGGEFAVQALRGGGTKITVRLPQLPASVQTGAKVRRGRTHRAKPAGPSGPH
jgi:PAS domain S-box-containing protein